MQEWLYNLTYITSSFTVHEYAYFFSSFQTGIGGTKCDNINGYLNCTPPLLDDTVFDTKGASTAIAMAAKIAICIGFLRLVNTNNL